MQLRPVSKIATAQYYAINIGSTLGIGERQTMGPEHQKPLQAAYTVASVQGAQAHLSSRDAFGMPTALQCETCRVEKRLENSAKSNKLS